MTCIEVPLESPHLHVKKLLSACVNLTANCSSTYAELINAGESHVSSSEDMKHVDWGYEA